MHEYRRGGAPATPLSDEHILEARAARLARTIGMIDDRALITVMVLRLGREQYAVELKHLRSIEPATGLSHVPCTPRHVAGIVNIRGDIVTVLDLAVLLHLPEVIDPAGDRSAASSRRTGHIMLADRAYAGIGLLVEEDVGVDAVPVERIHPSPSGDELTRGVIDTCVTLLDLDRILVADRLEVYEEIH